VFVSVECVMMNVLVECCGVRVRGVCYDERVG